MSKITIKVPYYIENCGDGSAAVRLCKSLKEAKKKDNNQNRDGEGWGEDSADEIVLELDTETLVCSIVEYKSKIEIANKCIEVK